MRTETSYFTELTGAIANAWDRFWFTRRDPSALCILRILAGLAATLYVASYTSDLITWFGPSGLLPIETVRLVTGQLSGSGLYHWSYFNYVTEPGLLWTLHFLGLATAICFTCGVFSRTSGLLTLVVVLAYLHRAPILNGLWEPVLTMLLIYLFWSPCGAKYSIDAWWKRRQAPAADTDGARDSVTANISIRLIQVHLAAFYATMAMTKLAGTTWWEGEAVWWLIARSESRLIDLTGLHASILIFNAWTHAIVLFELCFAVLIWFRLARPILIAGAICLWVGIGLLTGELGFCATILFSSMAFVAPQRWSAWSVRA